MTRQGGGVTKPGSSSPVATETANPGSGTGTGINLPMPLDGVFTTDELAITVGAGLIDAAFVIDGRTQRVVGANSAFLEIVGHEAVDPDVESQGLSAVIHPDDRGLFLALVARLDSGSAQPFEVRLTAADGAAVPVEITVRAIRWRGNLYHLAFVRPCAERQRREADLRRQLEQQKRRAMEALKSSLRVYQLNEKIRSTLVLTKNLLNAENEEKLFEESVGLLTHEEGLNFREASIFVLEGNNLRVACTTNRHLPASFPFSENNKYSTAVRTGFPSSNGERQWDDREMIFALRCRDSLLGVIEVSQFGREKAFFEENRLISEWQREMLLQIADIIALLLDNLRLNRELKRQSIIDPLTGAFNRNFFMTRLDTEVRRSARYSRPLSLLFIDVDHFKQVNDQYGHLQGDVVLRELGALFLRNLRHTDLLCRYGGDEFVVILPETGGETAQATGEKIRRSVREFAFHLLEAPQVLIPMTVSLGINTLRAGQSTEEFLHSSDEALYAAKKQGRDRGTVAV
jgi:diguanylate cyclase (GGDEF)-like protein/PAS domain S-box-containing protein